ncbi:MAG: PspA/IM30 family protein [Clostridiales bacterium]|nr:PspA/IM30 family protein [Clostridiales bacterium]
MGILSRFADIISANINALLDKAEDPEKMIDEYLRKMTKDLSQVKSETANVMAEETRTKRLLNENQAEIEKYTNLAKKALTSGNEGDAKTFLAKKQQVEEAGVGLQTAYATAHENAVKMRQLHDKLVKDINELNSRRQTIKAKVAIAKTQERISKYSSVGENSENSINKFRDMENKVDHMLDRANAISELNEAPTDEAESLAQKYGSSSLNVSVEEELAAMKKEMGLE